MTNELEYHQQLLPLSRAELVDKLRHAMKKKRFDHVLRVEETAIELAKENGVDLELASIAALCHDYAKQRPNQDFIATIKEKHLDPVLLNYGNAIWHGVVGAELVADELGCHDQRILDAVRQHTVGAPYMTKLAQIVYMADYIEPGRDFEGVELARQVTHQSLAKGVALQTKQTLMYLVSTGKPVYPTTLATYNAWVPSNGKED
ncbi:HD domain-containing protein [Limosilactobacillus fermentum]